MTLDSLSVDADFDALAYSYALPYIAAHTTASAGERSLWCAVIEQAFMDAGLIVGTRGAQRSSHSAKANNKERDAALRWLLRDKQDFIQVCLLANVPPLIIRQGALYLLKQHMQR